MMDNRFQISDLALGAVEAVKCQRRRRGRCAFIMLDTAFGLAVVGVLIVALGMATADQKLGLNELAKIRRTAHVAEQLMTQMQSGQAADVNQVTPDPHEPAQIVIRRLDDVDAIDGYVWVEVNVTKGRQISSLTGLVPVGAAPVGLKEAVR